jgi:hypothetical protein
MLWVIFARADAWVHSSFDEPVILMLSVRLGGELFLAYTKISFWSFFSLDKTGQILVLACSWLGGTEMLREVK